MTAGRIGRFVVVVVAGGFWHLQKPFEHELTFKPFFLGSSQMRPLAHAMLRHPRHSSPICGYVVPPAFFTQWPLDELSVPLAVGTHS